MRAAKIFIKNNLNKGGTQMEKKNLFKLFSGILVLMLMLSFGTANAASPPPRKGWPKHISITAPTVGATPYIVMEGLALMIKRHLGIEAGATTVGGSEAMLLAMNRGEVEMGYVGVLENYQSVRGEGRFKDNKVQARQLFAAWPLCYPIFATKASGITKFEDLRGKRVMWNSPTAAVIRETARSLFECYGFNNPEKDTVAMPIGNMKEGGDGLRARTADAFMYIGSATSAESAFAELTDTLDCVAIPLDREKIACVMKKKPYIFQGKMKGGIYKGIPNDVPALGLSQPISVLASFPEDLAYEIMKLVFDPAYRAEFEGIHPVSKFITEESAMVYTNVPFHAGAVKYYKDRGWWKIEDVHKNLLKEIGQSK